MAGQRFNLALEITADGSPAIKSIRNVDRAASGQLGGTAGRLTSLFGGITRAVGGLLGPIGAIGGALTSAFMGALSIVGSIGKALLALPLKGLKFGLGTLAAGGAAVYAAHKALGPAAQIEQQRVRLDALGKGELFDFLSTASSGKPFQQGETVEAGIRLEARGISAKKTLETAMDAAAGFGLQLEEVVRLFGYAKAGRAGEVFERGLVTRKDFEKLGIKFDANNAIQKNMVSKLLPTLLTVLKGRFGGIAQKVGTQTYTGAVSDLKDSIFRAFDNAFKDFLPAATLVAKGIGDVVTTAGKWVKSFDWKNVGEGLVKYFRDVKDIAKGMFTEGGFDFLLKVAKQLDFFGAVFADLKIAFKIGASYIGEVFKSGASLVARGIADALLGKKNTKERDAMRFADAVWDETGGGPVGKKRLASAALAAQKSLGLAAAPEGWLDHLPASMRPKEKLDIPEIGAASNTREFLSKLASEMEKYRDNANQGWFFDADFVQKQQQTNEETRDAVLQQNQILKQTLRFHRGMLIELPQ